jgi:hypothetical protein
VQLRVPELPQVAVGVVRGLLGAASTEQRRMSVTSGPPVQSISDTRI